MRTPACRKAQGAANALANRLEIVRGHLAAAKDELRTLMEKRPVVEDLEAELCNLERRTRSACRDLVEHPPRENDDLANAVAGVCPLLGARPIVVEFMGQASY